MPEGSEVAELQRRGLNISGFAGAHPLGGGYCHSGSHEQSLEAYVKPPAPEVCTTDHRCHGLSLDDDKAPASALILLPAGTPASTPASMLATTPTATPIATPARLLWDVQ